LKPEPDDPELLDAPDDPPEELEELDEPEDPDEPELSSLFEQATARAMQPAAKPRIRTLRVMKAPSSRK
jgi:hypothetical protein